MPKLPKPFQKPSIDLGAPKHGREWKDVLWADIEPGDTVADRGVLKKIQWAPEMDFVKFIFPERSTTMKSAQAKTEKVFAFVKVNA